MRKLLLFLSLSSCILISSCQIDKIDLPDVKDEFKFIDFDTKLIGLDTAAIQKEIDGLMVEHPAFSQLYFNSILDVGSDDGIDMSLVSDFISDPSIKHLKDTIDLIIDKEALQSEFTEALSYIKHYFPNWHIPNIYTLMSGFGYQRFLFEDESGDAIGVGLEFFLGSQYPYKNIDPNNPSFSSYQTRSFNKEHIVKKSLEVWLDDKLAPLRGSRMIDHMIRNGKMLYVLDKLLPSTNDTVVTEYSLKQLEWAKGNELQIWTFFLDEDLFFETNMRKLNKYINPSPDAPGMPIEAPGRIANYMGWQIVEAYMRKNPEVSIENLLMDSDAQRILDKSKYKPKKS